MKNYSNLIGLLIIGLILLGACTNEFLEDNYGELEANIQTTAKQAENPDIPPTTKQEEDPDIPPTTKHDDGPDIPPTSNNGKVSGDGTGKSEGDGTGKVSGDGTGKPN